MRADATLRPLKRSRTSVILTGEELTEGHSARARSLVVEVEPGSVDFARLTKLQRDARSGLFAAAFSAYVQNLAPRLDEVLRDLPATVARYRDDASQPGLHPRVAGAIELVLRSRLLLELRSVIGALDDQEAIDLAERSWGALHQVAGSQIRHHASADPVPRFFELLCLPSLAEKPTWHRLRAARPSGGQEGGAGGRAVATR